MWVGPNSETCERQAVYGFATCPGRTRCREHALPEMVSKSPAYCKGRNADGTWCRLSGRYGIPPAPPLLKSADMYCLKHAGEGMVDQTPMQCEAAVNGGWERCANQALYGFWLTREALFCSDHKLEHMVKFTNESASRRAKSNLERWSVVRRCMSCRSYTRHPSCPKCKLPMI